MTDKENTHSKVISNVIYFQYLRLTVCKVILKLYLDTFNKSPDIIV